MTEHSHKEAYTGQIVFKSNEGEDELLGLVGQGINLLLAEEIEEKIELHGEYLAVRYWSSDTPLSGEAMKEAFVKTLYGLCLAEYNVHYSEITGYLWTDENLVVGGHNLLQELKRNVDRYLHLEIEFSRGPDSVVDRDYWKNR